MIALIGLDHRHTTAEFRGRLGFSDDRLSAALNALTAQPEVDEAVILSTCNRTEVYLAAKDWSAARATVYRLLTAAYSQGATAVISSVPSPATPSPNASQAVEYASLPASTALSADAFSHLPAELALVLYEYEGIPAVNHLCNVAAGLESMVIGEAQILGQVREAMAIAEAEHTLGEELRPAFTTALKVGKRARTETEIGRADISIAALAITVAEQTIGTLAARSALLIGAGKTSELCGALLREQGIGRLMLSNRTAASAVEVAERLGAGVVPLADIVDVLPDIDLVVSATAAPYPVLRAADVVKSAANRTRPLVILDLAVPPDVEATVSDLPGVTLYSLDALRTLGTDAPLVEGPNRQAEIERVNEIVSEGVREYVRSRAVRLAVPGIAALRRHVDRSERAELESALLQLEHLSDADRAIVSRFGQRLVDKMFHHLVSRIRSLAEYDEIPPDVTMQVLAQLFVDPDDRA